jgi:hypothetical protein
MFQRQKTRNLCKTTCHSYWSWNQSLSRGYRQYHYHSFTFLQASPSWFTGAMDAYQLHGSSCHQSCQQIFFQRSAIILKQFPFPFQRIWILKGFLRICKETSLYTVKKTVFNITRQSDHLPLIKPRK